MTPVSITAFCFSCRTDTPHRLAKPPLYYCEKNCGSAWRHITNPHERTPEALKIKKEAELLVTDYWKKENHMTVKLALKAVRGARKRRGHGH